jgi:hypothetical protein
MFPATTTGLYWCEVTGEGGCTDRDSINLILYPALSVSAGSDTLIEMEESIVLEGTASGGSGNLSYHWQPEELLLNPDVLHPETIEMTVSTLFTLTVTDNESGCTASDEVIVNVEFPLLVCDAVADPDTVCSGGQSQLNATLSGGTGIYSFLWSSVPSGFFSTSPNPVVFVTQNTLFIVEVTDGYQTAVDSVWVYIHPEPKEFMLLGGGFVCEGGTGRNLFLNGSELYTLYELFRGPETTGVVVAGTGSSIDLGTHEQAGWYTVIATALATGCQVLMADPVQIEYFNYGTTDQISAVSVDLQEQKNVITWVKTMDDAISSYNIYLESEEAGIFNLIANVAHADPAIYMDLSSNPSQRSSSYALTTVDTCNNESAFSEVHSAIHLVRKISGNEVDLEWTPYSGISFDTYFIHRRQLPGGFQVLASVHTSASSYSDPDPPAGTLDYVIEIRNKSDGSTEKNDREYQSVFSNIVSVVTGIEEKPQVGMSISIFPNPALGVVNLQFTVYNVQRIGFKIYDLQGMEVAAFVDGVFPAGEHIVQFNAEQLDAGIYIIQLTNTNYPQPSLARITIIK